jgi:simple sugar transport system permease protein
VNVDDWTTIIDAAVRLSVPLVFVAVGEWVAERAGTLNISVEGMMLAGAFLSIVGADWVGSPAAGLLFGMAAGAAIALVHGQFSHRMNANTFVVGITLTILVTGLTSFLLTEIEVERIRTGIVSIPLLEDVPVVGPGLFSQRWPAYLVWPLIPFAWWLVYRSRWGLEVRAVGENPQAADVSGIPVNRRRRQALLVCGLTSGLGGAYLAVGEVGVFTREMTGGRGFIALAAVIFGGWRLAGTVIGCALFGTADSLRLALPALGYELNPQLLIMSPYLLAIVVMVLFAGRHRRPHALGRPYERGAVG